MPDNNNQDDKPTNNNDVIPAYRYDQLDKAHKTVTGKVTTLEKELERYKGIDPEEYFALKSSRDEEEKNKLSKSPDKLDEHWNKKMLEARKEWDSKLTNIENENKQLRSQVRGLQITDRVMLEVAPLFNPDTHKWIKLEVERRADLDADGKLVFKDERGEVIFSAENRTEPMGTKEFAKLLVNEFPSAAKPTGPGGAADMTRGNRVTGSGKAPTTMAELNALPNPREVLAKMSAEDREILLKNTRF